MNTRLFEEAHKYPHRLHNQITLFSGRLLIFSTPIDYMKKGNDKVSNQSSKAILRMQYMRTTCLQEAKRPKQIILVLCQFTPGANNPVGII